jgi:hypothetical protein
MKKFILAIALLITTNSTTLFAQSVGGATAYNKSTFVTKTGIVSEVEENANNPMMGEKGLHIYIKSKGTKYRVHVSPQWYANKNKIKFRKGQKITVSGSEFYERSGWTAGNNIYAATITDKKSGKSMKFRDKNSGQTLWAGRHQGKMQDKMMKKHQSSQNKEAIQNDMRAKMREQMQKKMMSQGGPNTNSDGKNSEKFDPDSFRNEMRNKMQQQMRDEMRAKHQGQNKEKQMEKKLNDKRTNMIMRGNYGQSRKKDD